MKPAPAYPPLRSSTYHTLMDRLRPRIYYGWVALAAISGISFANAVTAVGLLTVFIIPITEEFDWSRTQFSAATSVGAVLGAGLAPFTGRLSDRLGARLLLATGAVLIALATLYLSLMQTLVGLLRGLWPGPSG